MSSDKNEEVQEEIKQTRSYVEEVYRQIQVMPGVKDILILNSLSNPIKATMDMSTATKLGGLYQSLLDKVVYSLKKIDPSDELVMLRLRTANKETLITPDKKITAVVVQEVADIYFDERAQDILD